MRHESFSAPARRVADGPPARLAGYGLVATRRDERALHSFRFASPTTRRRPTPSENGLIPGLASPASSSGRIAPSVTREWSERDINVWGFQVCSGSFRQQKLTLCVTMKQRWIFHSYVGCAA